MKRKHFALALVIAYTGFFWLLAGYSKQSLHIKRISNSLNDTLFKVRYASDAPPSVRDKIVIIAVDDESAARLGLRWPWPREVFADLIRKLKAKGVSVIGLNFTFTGFESGNVESTQDLAEAIREHGRVVVGSSLEADRLMKPSQPLLEAKVSYGFLEKIVDDDFVIRKSYLKRRYRMGGDEQSFPLALWRAQDASDRSLENWTARDGSYSLNYRLKEGDLKTLSAWKLLQDRVSEETLSGKTALVGITSSSMSEKHYTPLGLMPGLYVHLNEWAALEENRPLQALPQKIVGAWSWVLGLLLLFLFLSRRLWLMVLAYGMAFFFVFLAEQFFIARDILVPFFAALSGPLLSLSVGFFGYWLHLFLENQGLEKKVLHDKMTGLYNYEYLRLRLDDEWKRCQKFKLPVSVVMTDLDRFKKINDTLGHETGNQMILRAAAVIRESVRGYDVVSRYGGDEFVILLWHSSRAEAEAYRLRLRKMYETMAAGLDQPLLKESSVSIGIASFEPTAGQPQVRSAQELVEAADKDLFADKESRRKPGEPRR